MYNVIVHSDQGSTYASGGYQQQLSEYKLLCSMSRKGECLDNAVAESFIGGTSDLFSSSIVQQKGILQGQITFERITLQ